MLRFSARLFCLLVFSATLSAQQQPTPVFAGDEAPAWMLQMLGPDPNVFAIEKAYRDYYADRPFEKNRYTQFYKRWMHWARPYTQEDGSLHLPDVNEQAATEQVARALRAKSGGPDGGAGVWSFAGPNQTFHTDGLTEVTWQTNIYALDIAASDPNTVYAGGETGGLWKTTDKGLHWSLLTRDVTHGAFGAVKVHPADPNTVYAATGGKLLKSSDGGASWTSVYTENNLWINELAIRPDAPEVVLAASEKGLLRSADGGASWQKLFANFSWTVKFQPGNPNVAFAVRQNGAGVDCLKSTDGGATWNTFNTGIWTPGQGQEITGAIVAVCPSKPSRVYVYFCGSGPNLYGYVGVFVSDDNGETWANTHPTKAVGTPYAIPGHTNLMAHDGTTGFDQGFYDMAIIVNPANEQQLIAGGTSWFKSNDGGKSWQALGSYVGGLPWSHPDIQALAAQGADLWIASDGGINYSANFAQSIEARMNGISGADLWGFDSGWNEDILVGGRYHNGNMAYHESFPPNVFYRMGGAEAATGYVNPGPGRKTYFSDIGGYGLAGGLEGGVGYFPVGLFPNESYAYYANSEMVWHPQCWGIVFLGNDNKIWKSTDGGLSFTALFTFPGTAENDVYDIEISRADPRVMYCSQWDGTDDAIWRSADGGLNWTKCQALPLPNNNDRVKLAGSAEDAQVLWCAVTYGSNGKKVYKSTDGGQNWENLTTALLNGVRITNLMAQYGTDGGVYLGTNRGVFYRNNNHSDWQPYSDGLPLSAETNRLKPFYRDGKIRNGCWGFGVWEAPLFEPSQTLPQAMADKLESGCARDTFYFDDYSVLRHTGVSWNWQFPDAASVFGENTRTPKVVFGKAGDFQAIMKLSAPEGTFYDTLHLRVGNGCARDSFPGQALQVDGDGDYAVASAPLLLHSDTVTITAWIKWLGAQSDRAGIVFCRSSNTTAGIGFDGDRLSYHWNDEGWWWNSGLSVPQNEWAHVALVAQPDKITLYLNGIAAADNTPRGAEEFDGPLSLGEDPNGGGRWFNGLIDEVCVYQRALSQAEIREQMHLVKLDPGLPGLKAYYQFNESGGPALDRAATRHVSLGGDAQRATSTLAVGPGSSQRVDINGAGAYDLSAQTGFFAQTPASGGYPKGEVCVTRINLHPDFKPDTTPISRSYWVVRNYGINPIFSPLKTLRFNGIGQVPAGSDTAAYKLWYRFPSLDGDSWTLLDAATAIEPGPDGSVVFAGGNAITEFGQFAVTRPSGADDPLVSGAPFRPDPAPEVRVSPNPVSGNAALKIRVFSAEACTFRLFDDKGRVVRLRHFESQTELPLAGLPAGTYFYQLGNEKFLRFGRLGVW